MVAIIVPFVSLRKVKNNLHTCTCALQCIWFRATTIRMSGAAQVKVLRLQAPTTVLCLPSLKLERCE